MLVEELFKQIVQGLFNISTKSFFNFGFPKIISNGKNIHPVMILKGVKKNNLACLVTFLDAIDVTKTIAKNKAEPKDTVYLLLIEVAFCTGVVEPDNSFCPLFCL